MYVSEGWWFSTETKIFYLADDIQRDYSVLQICFSEYVGYHLDKELTKA